MGVFTISRRCERYIAEQCIREYLFRRAAAAPPNAATSAQRTSTGIMLE
jgi:hypothetical protein